MSRRRLRPRLWFVFLILLLPIIVTVGTSLTLVAVVDSYNPRLIPIVYGVSLPCCVVICWFMARRVRRRSMAAKRPQLERLLDGLIALVRDSREPLDRFVIFNISDRHEDGSSNYELQMRDGPNLVRLSVFTHDDGDMRVTTVRKNPKGPEDRFEYPSLADGVRPEPWLTDRLDRLRGLVGDASRYATLKGEMLADMQSRGYDTEMKPLLDAIRSKD